MPTTPVSAPSHCCAAPPGSGSAIELWAFRCLVAAVFSIAFSIALGETMLGLTLLLFCVALVLGKLDKPFWPRIGWMVVAFAVAATVATFTGPNARLGLKRSTELLWYLAIPASAILVNSAARLRHLLKGFALGCGALCLHLLVTSPFAALKACSTPRFAGSKSPFLDALIDQGSMTDGQMLMLGIVLCAGLVFAAAREKRRTVGWIALLVLLCLCQVMNYKRGSWITTVAVLGMLLALKANWRFLVVLLALTLFVALLPPVWHRLAGLGRELDVKAGGRLTMWRLLTPAFASEYPLGLGYNAMTAEMMQEMAARVGARVETGRNHLHNNAAQVLVETGWTGLAVFVMWILWALRSAALLAWHGRAAPPGDAVAALMPLLFLAGLLLNGVVEYNFGDTELLIMYAVAMGVSAPRPALRAGCHVAG